MSLNTQHRHQFSNSYVDKSNMGLDESESEGAKALNQNSRNHKNFLAIKTRLMRENLDQWCAEANSNTR